MTNPSPTLNVVPGTIFHMDNILALRGINSGTIDLIATDPPFNTGRNREAVGGQYPDQWLWDEGKNGPWLEQIRDLNRAVAEVIESAMHAHTKNLGAFLCFLAERLIECHRILKDTGSIYVHLDQTASHYVKGIMDAIFGAKNFRNEIVWAYEKWTNAASRFQRNHDVILFYAMSSNSTFNKIRGPRTARQDSLIEAGYNLGTSGDGSPIVRIYNPDHPKVVEQIDRWRAEGRAIYQVNPQGKALSSVWVLPMLNGQAKERTGYPDQKPVALYERIVTASSNEGDLVLDPFCGCGTTLVAAGKLGRQFIGIDRNDDAKEMILCSLAGTKKADLEIIRKKTRHTDPGWIDRQLANHEAIFTTDPPERTDDLEEETTPGLPTVHRHKERTIFDPHTMKRMLYEKFGSQCWGCDFQAPAGDRGIKYLELDHISPRADGGSNQLTNRALLCGPCNKEKSDNLTLGALRRQIYGNRKKANQHPIDLKAAAAWTRHQELEELLRREAEDKPLFAK